MQNCLCFARKVLSFHTDYIFILKVHERLFQCDIVRVILDHCAPVLSFANLFPTHILCNELDLKNTLKHIGIGD